MFYLLFIHIGGRPEGLLKFDYFREIQPIEGFTITKEIEQQIRSSDQWIKLKDSSQGTFWLKWKEEA